MNRPWKYVAVSLLVGLLAGAASGLLIARCAWPRWGQRGPQAMMKHFDRKLDLTEPQKEQIHAILKSNREKMGAYRKQVRQTASSEIRQLLTPEQQTRFDAMEAKMEARWQKRRMKSKP